MTVYSVISLPKIPYIHRIHMVLANPMYIHSVHDFRVAALKAEWSMVRLVVHSQASGPWSG